MNRTYNYPTAGADSTMARSTQKIKERRNHHLSIRLAQAVDLGQQQLELDRHLRLRCLWQPGLDDAERRRRSELSLGVNPADNQIEGGYV